MPWNLASDAVCDASIKSSHWLGGSCCRRVEKGKIQSKKITLTIKEAKNLEDFSSYDRNILKQPPKKEASARFFLSTSDMDSGDQQLTPACYRLFQFESKGNLKDKCSVEIRRATRCITVEVSNLENEDSLLTLWQILGRSPKYFIRLSEATDNSNLEINFLVCMRQQFISKEVASLMDTYNSKCRQVAFACLDAVNVAIGLLMQLKGGENVERCQHLVNLAVERIDDLRPQDDSDFGNKLRLVKTEISKWSHLKK